MEGTHRDGELDSPGPAGTRTRSGIWWTPSGTSCRSTATGSSAPPRTPRMRFRRHCWRPARAGRFRGARVDPHLAVPDRHQPLPKQHARW
jgi:hypothetical protein